MAKAASTAALETSDLRARILAASVGLLEEQGISGLSMREVARRAGVSHQAPYHHFADREAILAAIVQDGFGILSAEIVRLVSAAKSKRVSRAIIRETITSVLVAYVQFAWKYPGHFGLMFRPELCDLERFPEAETQAQAAMNGLHELVAFAVQKHPAWQERQSELATTFWSIAHGYASLSGEGPLCRKMALVGVTPEEHLRDVSELVGLMVTAALDREPPSR